MIDQDFESLNPKQPVPWVKGISSLFKCRFAAQIFQQSSLVDNMI